MTTKGRALMPVGKQLFNLTNLTGTDFSNVSASEVKRKEAPDITIGVHLQFTVSLSALEKALNNEAFDALWSIVNNTAE